MDYFRWICASHAAIISCFSFIIAMHAAISAFAVATMHQLHRLDLRRLLLCKQVALNATRGTDTALYAHNCTSVFFAPLSAAAAAAAANSRANRTSIASHWVPLNWEREGAYTCHLTYPARNKTHHAGAKLSAPTLTGTAYTCGSRHRWLYTLSVSQR